MTEAKIIDACIATLRVTDRTCGCRTQSARRAAQSVVGYGRWHNETGVPHLCLYVNVAKPDISNLRRIYRELDVPMVVRNTRPLGWQHVAVSSNPGFIHRDGGEHGSLGCFVQRLSAPDEHYVLSNAHVMAWGSQQPAAESDPILAADGTEIAKLSDWVRPIPGPGFENVIDAAIARTELEPDNVIEGLGSLVGSSAIITPNMLVRLRSPATQQVSVGRVTDLNFNHRFTPRIPGQPPSASYGFMGQVIVEPVVRGGRLTAPGDSGSVWVNEQNEVVGLHVAGSHLMAAFCRFSAIRKRFDVDVIPVATQADTAFVARSVPQADSDSLDTVARTIFGEARGENRGGRIAVAWVIRNRVSEPGWWGDDYVSVCRKAWQFSCWNQGDPNYELLLRVDDSNAVFRECLDVADDVVSGRAPDPTYGATHYHHQAIQPTWSVDAEPSVRIGVHVFYNDIS